MVLQNLPLTLINGVVFVLFVTIFWFLAGVFLIPKKVKLPVLDRILLATTFGFSSYVFSIFLVRLMGLPFWVGYLPSLYLVFQYWRRKDRKLVRLPRSTVFQKIALVLAIVAAVLQGLVLLRNGIYTEKGLWFSELSIHDSSWHIYLINELKSNFPPRHAGFAPFLVKNYHFLLDLTLASIGKYLPLSTFELYYRIVPVFISLMTSLGIFVVTRRITHSEKIAVAALFLGMFAGNASWFVQFFRGEEFHYSANTFMLDPMLDLMQNPHAVVVFPLLLAGILSLILLEQKGNRTIMMLTGITLGVMIGFKAWGGTLVLLSLPVASFWMSLKYKRHDIWGVWLIAGLVSAIIFIPIYDAKTAAGLIWIPGWLLKRMVEDPDRYNMPKYYFLEQHYKATYNYIRLIQINLTELFIYLFGNLWLRVLGLWVIIKYFLKSKAPSQLFMIVVSLASLFLPVFFNQGRMAYDIIQYGPYGLLILAIFTAPVLVKLSTRLPRVWQIPTFIILLLLSVPSNTRSVSERFQDRRVLIVNDELAAYNFLRTETDLQSIVMLYPSHQNISTALIAALTGKPTYFSAQTFSRITGEDYDKRRETLLSFFNIVDPEKRQKIIKEIPIKYLLLNQEEEKNFITTGLNLSKVFSTEKISIFKFN